MNKNYKVSFSTQFQVCEDGKTKRHNHIKTTLPADAVADMGITKENNLINISYDEDKKQLIIKKA